MNRLIKAEKTGTPEEFAAFLGISTSHLYRCIEEIKEMGAPVSFSRIRKTYFYKHDFDLKINYSVEIVSEDSKRKIFGGLGQKKCSLLFFESGHA